jgi:hypothetical protein
VFFNDAIDAQTSLSLSNRSQMPKREKITNVSKSMKQSLTLVPDMFASLIVGGSSIFAAKKMTEEPIAVTEDYQDPIELQK